MGSKKLSILKIVKFAGENGFEIHKIYKVRGSIRFILMTDEESNILAVEVPIEYIVDDKQDIAKNIRSSSINQKHESYWSIMNTKITDYDLICCGSSDITVFKHNGETKGYIAIDDDFNYESSDDEKEGDLEYDQLSEIERKADKLIKSTTQSTFDKLRERQKIHPIKQITEIIFQDENGKTLTDEELANEPPVNIVTWEEMEEIEEKNKQKEETIDKVDILKEKLSEISQLDDEIELDLGNFYLLVKLNEFYKNIDEIKDKLDLFTKTMKSEEAAILSGRIENITLSLSSIHQTIQTAFDWYTEKEEKIKEKLQKLISLYEKIKDVNSKITDEHKKDEMNVLKEELRQLIKSHRQDLCTIRDLIQSLLGKLEEDVEKITQRCALPTVKEEIEEPEVEEN